MAVWSSGLTFSGLSVASDLRKLRDNITALAEDASGAPDIEGTAIASQSIPENRINGLNITYTEINNAADGAGVSIPIWKVYNIGAWNMQTTPSIDIAHGLSLTKIIAVRGMITRDDYVYFFPIHYVRQDGTHYELYVSNIDSTNVTISHGPYFSNTYFNDTGINRGYVVIAYLS